MKNKIKINDHTLVCNDYFVLSINGNKIDAISSAKTDEKVMLLLAPFVEDLILKLSIPTKN